jgi:hypothetical protein
MDEHQSTPHGATGPPAAGRAGIRQELLALLSQEELELIMTIQQRLHDEAPDVEAHGAMGSAVW